MGTYVGPNARVRDNARVRGNAWVQGNARVRDNAEVGGNARVGGNAVVGGEAEVRGNAVVGGEAEVRDNAEVRGNAEVGGNARVVGNACLTRSSHLAWVDRVGSGHPMTLHRISLDDDGFGWRINAGCRHFEAPTVQEVCDLVKQNLKTPVEEWSHGSSEEQSLWAKQVRAALKYLASMVED
jgi:carbonic anhydrase/acetyltransferase-like protein (isoleucine patch superfamily)